jgi:hypothetical protein
LIQIESKLQDACRTKARGKSDREDVINMYQVLYEECKAFGWREITKPWLVVAHDNQYLPESDESEREPESDTDSDPEKDEDDNGDDDNDPDNGGADGEDDAGHGYEDDDEDGNEMTD